MKKPIIIFLILTFLVCCEKTAEDYFDYSLITGQGYFGKAIEYKFFGMSSSNINSWGYIHQHDPCSLEYVRTIPPKTMTPYGNTKDNRYDAEVIRLEGKRYLIKIYVDDPFIPKEFEVELNGKYYEAQLGDYFAYFDIKETELYEASNCNASHFMVTGNYFKVDKYIPNWMDFHLEIKSKTGDSLVWYYSGRKL